MISVTYTEGPQLSADLLKHIEAYEIRLLEHRRVTAVKPDEGDGPLGVTLDSGETLSTERLIIATGAKWRELGIDGEKEYLGRGVAFCPHCDGPYYKGKDIAVIGGGNSGVEAAIDLSGIVKSVTVVEFMPTLKADEVLQKKLRSLPNANVVTNAKTTRVLGDGGKVTALEYENRETGDVTQLDLDGVFVQIGLVPNSGFLDGLVETNRFGEILVDAKGRTNVPRIYAAGDICFPFKFTHTADALAQIDRIGQLLIDGLEAQAESHGLSFVSTGPAAMPSFHFGDDPEHTTYFEWCDLATEQGAYLHPNHNWFVSAAHTEADVDLTLRATDQAFGAIAAGRG